MRLTTRRSAGLSSESAVLRYDLLDLFSLYYFPRPQEVEPVCLTKQEEKCREEERQRCSTEESSECSTELRPECRVETSQVRNFFLL